MFDVIVCDFVLLLEVFYVVGWSYAGGVTMFKDGDVVVGGGSNFGSPVSKKIVNVGGSQVVAGRGGDCEKFLFESRPICFGKLSAGLDWYLDGVGGNGDEHRDVVRRSCGAGS